MKGVPKAFIRVVLCKFHIYTAAFLWWSLSGFAIAQPQVVLVPSWVKSNQQDDYFVALLALAFSKTEAAEGAVEIHRSAEIFSGTRFLSDLKNNITIDVIWHGTNKQREQDLLPIRISLLKNLNEYRLLLIRAEDQQKFESINFLEDFLNVTAGAGADWPSAEVMRYNGLSVRTVNNSSLLFTMLKSRRFDYMSRNAYEIWDEAETHQQEGLAVENHLMLHGGVPYYFFVNKSRKALADRIERGLKIALADGSFDALFYSRPEFRRGADVIANSKRKIIEMQVP